MSTCHCGANMTEVAQVAAVVAHDMDDVTNEDEHSMSDAENKENDKTHEEDDVNEDSAEEEESEKTSPKEDESEETDKTRMNGVGHKENDTANEKDEKSEAVNGVAQDTETKEDQSISDLAFKKEVSEEFKIINSEISWILPFKGTIYLRCTNNFIVSSFSLSNHRNSSDLESRWPEATCQS